MKIYNKVYRLKEDEIVQEGDFMNAKCNPQPKFGKKDAGFLPVSSYFVNKPAKKNDNLYFYRHGLNFKTKITWHGKEYVAPPGYYFLGIGDKIKKGDKFFGLNDDLKVYLIGISGGVDRNDASVTVRLIKNR